MYLHVLLAHNIDPAACLASTYSVHNLDCRTGVLSDGSVHSYFSNVLPVKVYYCNKEENFLFYDYMPLGSLHDLLHAQEEKASVTKPPFCSSLYSMSLHLTSDSMSSLHRASISCLYERMELYKKGSRSNCAEFNLWWWQNRDHSHRRTRGASCSINCHSGMVHGTICQFVL